MERRRFVGLLGAAGACLLPGVGSWLARAALDTLPSAPVEDTGTVHTDIDALEFAQLLRNVYTESIMGSVRARSPMVELFENVGERRDDGRGWPVELH